MNKSIQYFLATRPAFLIITLLGCLIGLLLPSSSHSYSWHINLLAIFLALSLHASANLLNDYFDHINGSDLINTERISPFTGGSRYIQEQIFTPQQIFTLGALLSLLSIGLGIYICSQTTWLLMPIGLVGVIIAWAYSSPPMQLMSRGIMGEIAIAMAWSLVVIGFATMHQGHLTEIAVYTGLSFGLMASNILLVNQIPDIKADQISGKYTLATQSSDQSLQLWFGASYGCAYLLQILGINNRVIPLSTAITLIAVPLFLFCSYSMRQALKERSKLKSLVLQNILAVHLYAVLLCLGLAYTCV
jgi:1,4-dihydroxy-2-naphthoate octaprenyltransferase